MLAFMVGQAVGMRVVAKFTFVFFLASLAILALFSYWSARREASEATLNALGDLRSFGEVLRLEFVSAWTTQGRDRALDTLRSATRRRSDVKVSWSSPGAPIPIAPRSVGAEESHLVTLDLPLVVGGEPVANLSLSRHVSNAGDVLMSTLREELGFTAALALSLGLLAVVLGSAVIGQPLKAVVAQAQRIGAGDFAQQNSSHRRDEIGELERAINEMCAQLGNSRDRLEREATARIELLEELRHLDRLRTVGTLASSLAHELGTPLNVLLLRGQAIAAGEDEAADLPLSGSIILAQVEKMSRIVRQLLDFSRRSTTMSEVRLSDVAHGTADLLRALAKKSNVTLRVEVRGDPIVQGEAVQLEQAVTNLVANGLHSMPNGGDLRLSVGVEHGARATESTAAVRAAFIAVCDQGCGIAPDQLTRIWEPFYSTRPAGEGTGLGLSVARGIAEDHGGWISAKSEPNSGSTFTLFIPATQG